MGIRRFRLIAEGVHTFDGCTTEGLPTTHRQVHTGFEFYSRRDMTQFGNGTRFVLVPDDVQAPTDDWATIRSMGFRDARKLTGLSASGWAELEAAWRARKG